MTIRNAAIPAVAWLFILTAGAAQAQDHEAGHGAHADREMWMTALSGGWHLMGMAHVFPAATFAAPFSPDSPLNRTDVTFPHAALMAQLQSPGARWAFRFMPNFEGLTLPNGDPTFGGWGEAFIDARHPHTLLHEAMLSFNWWNAPAGALSVSAGRGFAPYGTDDPMYRPALKYPTNHHLSQILERWTVNLAYLSDAGLGIELGVFDGNEPEDPWDISNIDHFGNSWSGRLSYRFGGAAAPWEASASYGRVTETHGGHGDLTVLYNAALRHDARYDFGHLYGLVEASTSDPEHGDGYFSLLGETQAGLGLRSRHRPFYRIEYATRPEYSRESAEGEGFFRYDHDEAALGATRWLINTAGYGFDATDLPMSARPFVEVSHNRIWHERGPEALAAPEVRFGGDSFWSIAVGARLFVGGGPMRMGSYGVIDPMTASMRDAEVADEGMHGPHREDEMHEGHAPRPDPPAEAERHEHPEGMREPHAMMDDPGMQRTMAFVVRLLEDPQVRRRIHAVHAYHEVWEDPAVQSHFERMRRMHGEDAAHRPAEPGAEMRGMMEDPGARRAMALVAELLEDPEVQRRIHAVHELHEAWEDPAVRRHLDMMRRMHGGEGEDHQSHPRDHE